MQCEMQCFITFLPLIVGEFVPEDDDVWLFLLNLIEIIDILLLFEIPQPLAERLRDLIKSHHQKYVRFFNNTLKPKHHLMVHYFQNILESGPPRHYWTFRFEAKHKEFKDYARSITSRKNVCVSFAKKYQLKFANFLFEPDQPMHSVESNHRINSSHNDLIDSFSIRNEINPNNFCCYSQCKYRCKLYKKGYVICQYLDNINCENTVIYQINEIVLFANCDSVHVVVNRMKVQEYHKHFASYVVEMSNEPGRLDFAVLSIQSLTGPPMNVHTSSKGIHFIRPNQFI